MKNKEEIIDLIIEQYGVNKARDHLRYEAASIDKLMLPDLMEIGHMNPGRWHHIADIYEQLDMLESDFSLDGFLYVSDPLPDFSKMRQVIFLLFLISLITSMVIISLYIFNKKLQKESQNRKLAIKALQESEAKFIEFMDHLPAYAFVKDTTGKYVYLNKSFDAITNSMPDERLRATDGNMFQADVVKELSANDAEVVKTGKTLEKYETITDVHGNKKTALTIKFPIIRDGALAFIGGISFDVTEKIEAEQETARLRMLLGSITDSMPSALVAMDKETRVLHWNKEAVKRSGIIAEKAVNMKIDQLFPKQSMIIELIEKALEENTIKILSNQVRYKNSKKICEDITAYPLSDYDFEGVVVRVDDVTERVGMEKMLIQSEKMLSVGGLAAGMVHEINNPLAGILQNTQVILNRFTKDLPANRKVADELDIPMGMITKYMAKRDILKLLSSIIDAGKRAAHMGSEFRKSVFG